MGSVVANSCRTVPLPASSVDATAALEMTFQLSGASTVSV